MTQGIEKQIRSLPAIETEGHFFQVGSEMLGTNLVPCAHDSALEKREGGFDGIGVNVSHDVHARTVINLLVICAVRLPHGRFIGGMVVCEDYFHVLGDVLADILCERSTFGIAGMEETKIAIALADADYDFFVIHAIDSTFAFVHAPDVCGVHFDLAVHHGLIGLRHCVPDAMAEVPRCFVAHSDRALYLASRHALLRFAEQVCSQKPLGQGQVRIVEYGAGSNGELIVAILAVEKLFLGLKLDHWHLAAQAARPFREAQAHQKLSALVLGRKQGVYVH